jgi:uncharacterized membrane protein YphA (DoxX/SURF4 family)
VSGSDAASLALLVFRIALGVVFLAHGWNHVFGGGKIAGTGRLGIALVGGFGGAAGLLVSCWRPVTTRAE